MATQTVTQSMRAKADQLISERIRWASGTRKADGRSFWLMPSSDGRTSYYVAQDGTACTCKSAFHRGLCGHMLAARIAADGEHQSNATMLAELSTVNERQAAALRVLRTMGED